MADGAANGSSSAQDSHPSWEMTHKVFDEELRAAGAAIRTVACSGDAVLTAPLEAGRLKRGAVGSSCVEASADGNTVAVCADDGSIVLWDLRDPEHHVGELEASVPTAWKAAFLPGGRHLVSGGTSGALCFWDLRMNRLESEIAADGAGASSSDFLRTKKGEEVDVKRRRKDLGRPSRDGNHSEADKSSPIYSLAASRDGRLLGCGRASGGISVLRLETREWVGDVQAHLADSSAPVRALSFDHGSRLLLSGGDDSHVCMVDAAGWARQSSAASRGRPQLERFPAHKGWVTSVSACPDPLRPVVVTTSSDAGVKLWDYRTRSLICSYQDHTDCVFASAFAPVDGRFFVTAGADAMLGLYVAKHDASGTNGHSTKEEALVPV
eukprot:CAMPEP_0115154956 /NCGR_PEP_ID=MMETSP0227-20121206/67604_1 /TAXON_ID=89957 /ORGANISM="Polarella glacialis, Strain CCMP 1383" /LENGTH=380 /DNA_ID=CAMNT_0002565933 /DNA_START=112 /DNA_END=1255 /DNA_ORIENTATION=-